MIYMKCRVENNILFSTLYTFNINRKNNEYNPSAFSWKKGINSELNIVNK